jgi:hypothetical protein
MIGCEPFNSHAEQTRHDFRYRYRYRYRQIELVQPDEKQS